MRGITDSIRPFIEYGGRVKLDALINHAMNDASVDETGTDFRFETYRLQIVSALNCADFYSVGDGEYAHISAMTDKEREQKSKEMFSRADSCRATGVKIIQSRINLETGEIEWPEMAEGM